MKLDKKIVDEQDEKVVGQDTQCRSKIKGKGFGTTDMVVVFFKVAEERLSNEKTCYDKENVDAMRHGHVSESVKGCVEQDSLGVTLHHAKNGKSPQKVQSKDSFPINIDVPKIPHWFWLVTSSVRSRCDIRDTVCACKNRNKGATMLATALNFPQ